jgi:cytochrome c
MEGSASKNPPRPQVAFGQPISEADIAPWNIDIRTPDGRGLPAGRGTADEGKKIYDAKCLACHGPDAKGGPVYGTMVGGIGSFTTNARVLTPGSMYPYAPILFDYIRRTMPMDRPQSLTNDEVYALAAYLLNLNGLIPANAVMDAKTLPAVQMPNRNGFIVDDRPDTKAVRCMSNCK